MSGTIRYRLAKNSDCSEILNYLDIASNGVFESFFNGMIPGLSYMDIMGEVVSDNSHHYSYASVIVAECESRVVGSMMRFDSKKYVITEEMKQYYPLDRLEYLKPWYEQEIPASILIESIAVDKNYRSKGVGKEFINLAKETAKSEGLDKLSLFVFEENKLAQKFYEREGFKLANKFAINNYDFLDSKCVFKGSRLMILEI